MHEMMETGARSASFSMNRDETVMIAARRRKNQIKWNKIEEMQVKRSGNGVDIPRYIDYLVCSRMLI
jgi:hypothetical protein